MRISLLSILLIGMLLFAFTPISSSIKSITPAIASTGNLILNPGAESGPGDDDGWEMVATIPNWTRTGNFNVIQYGIPSDVPATAPGPADRGLNFFAGGPSNPSSSASQTIDLSSYAGAIDTGNQAFSFSGYFGGWQWQEDNATLTVKFKNSVDTVLGTRTIGPVTNDQRGNVTSFYNRSTNGLVPALTRKVEVILQMTRYHGDYNDGYADSLYFALGSSSGGNISGKVYNDSILSGNEVDGAIIEACKTDGGCNTTSSASDGAYMFVNLADGQYSVRAFPPGGNNRLSGLISNLTISGSNSLQNKHLVLLQPNALPAGVDITKRGTAPGGAPSVYWKENLTLTKTGCAGGTATYAVIHRGVTIRSGSMLESPAGTYTAVIAALYPAVGDAQVVITLTCPSQPPTQISFNIWIDPSGVVVNTIGQPVVGATVTLNRSNDVSGPFEFVISGSAAMSPSNRTNPMSTDSAGRFGWDVIAGYYKVRAEKTGCVSASNHAQAYVETPVLTIPPPVTDLKLVMYCGETYKIYLPLTRK